MSTSRETPIEV
ncbi:unnamed protein product, partial [Allacma fusca]